MVGSKKCFEKKVSLKKPLLKIMKMESSIVMKKRSTTNEKQPALLAQVFSVLVVVL